MVEPNASGYGQGHLCLPDQGERAVRCRSHGSLAINGCGSGSGGGGRSVDGGNGGGGFATNFSKETSMTSRMRVKGTTSNSLRTSSEISSMAAELRQSRT